MEKMNFDTSLCGFLEYFLEKKLMQTTWSWPPVGRFNHSLTTLKLPSLLTAWPFERFIMNHILWKHWSFYVIHNHHFSYLLVYMEKMNFCGCLCGLLEYFRETKIPTDYICKSHDHDHQWANLFMLWLP